MDIKLCLAYHIKTDGKTEVVNCTIGNMIHWLAEDQLKTMTRASRTGPVFLNSMQTDQQEKH